MALEETGLENARTAASANALATLLHIKDTDDRQNVSEDEIRYMVTDADELTEQEKSMIHEVIDLGDAVAREVMIPRVDVEAAERPAGSQTKLYSGASNYWFLVPVECMSVGSAGNIEQGTALDPQSTIFNFVAASAYKTFSGGSDIEALDKTVARIKPSLSLRGLTNKDAVEAQLLRLRIW